MEITRYLWDRLWDLLQNLNISLGCFIIRCGLWMLVSAGLLYLSWAKLHSRSRFLQVLTLFAATILVFVLPLAHLVQAGVVYGFMIVVSLLAMIFMPPHISFFLTPIRGQQIKTKWILYGLVTFLFFIQLIAM